MGTKQSSPVFDGRTRAYSSSDLPSGNSSGGERIAGFRYTNGPDGPRIRYTGGGPTSSGRSIPASGRSGSHVLNQSLDGTDGDDEGQLPPDGHRLLIGSLPAHLSPHLLGGKIATIKHLERRQSHTWYVIVQTFLLLSSLFLKYDIVVYYIYII